MQPLHPADVALYQDLFSLFFFLQSVRKALMSVGYVWEDLYTRHNMGEYHPESPLRLKAVKNVIDDVKVAPFLTRLIPKPATKEELSWVHDGHYIDRIESTSGKFEDLDPDTSTCPATWDAALLAAGGVIACVDYVMEEKYSHGAFAFVRPPGHHAERTHAMGFCFFNNIAIGTEHAINKYGLKRVAVLDFDVHHGNGTQNHFYNRGDVLFASVHRHPFYPGTGDAIETGKGLGKGLNINVPLNGGGGDEEFRAAWDNILAKVEGFKPELIMVSAGFDAHVEDPLGGMKLTTGAYRRLASKLVLLSKKVCGGRLVLVLEGGYSLSALRSCVKAVLEEMI